MTFEEYRDRCREIDVKHVDDWESEAHLEDLFKLYGEYGNGVRADQQSGSVQGDPATGSAHEEQGTDEDA